MLLCAAADEANAAYCSEPSAPACTSSCGAFDDQDEFDQCRRQVSNYRDEVEQYQSCLSDASSEAASDFNEAVAAFNRRAQQ
jgi:hypothetical protein